jgi:hypothetical protein
LHTNKFGLISILRFFIVDFQTAKLYAPKADLLPFIATPPVSDQAPVLFAG